jgi:excisionase family DNA binding protein
VTKTVSIDKAAEILHVSRRTIYNHIQRGHLKTVRTIGGQSQRVTVDSLAVVQASAQLRGERLYVTGGASEATSKSEPGSEKRRPTT